MAQLRTLPLGDQVKTLMKNGKPRSLENTDHVSSNFFLITVRNTCYECSKQSLPCYRNVSLTHVPFLFSVKVMPFANLMGLLASGTDQTSVLRCIQQVALLVQGNWVVKRCEGNILCFLREINCYRVFALFQIVLMILFFLVPSDVLYPKNTCSAHSGVAAEVLCRGRDFVVSCYPPFFLNLLM